MKTRIKLEVLIEADLPEKDVRFFMSTENGSNCIQNITEAVQKSIDGADVTVSILGLENEQVFK